MGLLVRGAAGDIAIVAILAAYGALVLANLWDRPYLAALLLVPPPIILAWRLGDARRAAALALTGTILGPLTEMACVAGGLWTYADTGGLPLVPPWNFLGWACFPPAIWIITGAVLKTEAPLTPSPRTLAVALAGVGAEIAVFVSLGLNPPAALGGGAILAAAVILVFREKATLAMMGAGALLGPLCEYLPISAGAWWYSAPADLLGMPAYMILAYAIFGGLLGHASAAAGGLLVGDGDG
ncbi:MAG TPA: hypothetical protein PLZ42_04120 [Methanothrix sp.]|nr:hypothetical protein [Methanothrix sp.]